MRRRQEWSIEVKTPAQLARMREAGLVVAAALRAAVAAVEPGISTAELDAIAEREIRARRRGAVVPRVPRLSRDDLHLGQRAGRARHPELQRHAGGRGPDLHRLRRHRSAAGMATPP